MSAAKVPEQGCICLRRSPSFVFALDRSDLSLTRETGVNHFSSDITELFFFARQDVLELVVLVLETDSELDS